MYTIFLFGLMQVFFSNFSLNKLFQLYFTIYMALISLLFFGLRWRSGADYDGYLYIYNSIPSVFDFTYQSVKYIHGEIGFLFFSSILKSLGFYDFIYMFFLSLVSLFVKIYVYHKESKLPAFSLALYLLFLGMTYEFVQIRYALALSFLFLSLSFYVRGSVKFWLLFFLISCSFHYFVSIFIFLPLVRYIKLSQFKLLFLSIFLFFLISSLNIADYILILFSDYSGEGVLYRRIFGYMEGDEHYTADVSITSFLFIRVYFLCFLILILKNIYKIKSSKVDFYIKLMLFSLSISMLFSFSNIMFSRAISFVEILIFLILGDIVGKINRLNERLIVMFFLVSIGGSFFYKSLDSENVYNYVTWLINVS